MKKIIFACIVIIAMLSSIAGAQTPLIDSINPTSGPIGTSVTITGTGFASSGNVIHFQATTDMVYEAQITVSSADGKTLVFTVPSAVNPECYYTTPPCASPSLQVTSGQYLVYAVVSSAKSNAKEFDVTDSPIKGDVNGDQKVDIVDALVVARYAVGFVDAGFHVDVGDVNNDNAITIVDALLIAQYYIGLISQFPASTGEVQTVQSSLPRNMSPAPSTGEMQAVVDGNNQFTFDCYKQLNTGSKNLFYSPVSISFAFAMCYAGANGTTETEIANTLHFTLAEPNLHNAFNAFELAITTPPADPNPNNGEDLKLFIANSSWGQKNYAFVQAYLDTLATYYGAGMNLVDFKTAAEAARLLINDWVSQKTEARIKDLLPPGSVDTLTRLVLTNAIYFKANWLYPFDAAKTANGSFMAQDGTTVTVPMMNKVITTSYTEVAGEYQVIKLPYQGTKKNSMLIILPAAGRLEAVEGSLSLAAYNTIISGLTNYQVTFTMPKFGFEWSSSLKVLLQSLGMSDAWSYQTADFSGINGIVHDLYISDVFHKSFVAVDEKGTEATAATAIIMGTTSLPPAAVMTINRPFLFLIVNDHTGAILFAGKVAKP